MRSRVLGLTTGLLIIVAAAAAAAARDPRSMPPVEDRYLNVQLPDMNLTTADGAHTRLSAISRSYSPAAPACVPRSSRRGALQDRHAPFIVSC
jgi:hypothetical protein